MKVVLGVAGGIAAYKACSLLRLFTESGHSVTVVPTAAALEFVGAPTWAALSGQPVATGVFSDVHEVRHVRIGQEADLVVVAPATADLLARAAHGLANDLLTNTLLTARCPVVLAPAMHTEMWEHPATQANVVTLRERGVTVVEPADGRLTGKDTGKGRLPDPEVLYAAALVAAEGAASAAKDLAGRHVLVTAGGTREPIDPVRFLGNRSSGKQGIALAEEARDRGASVTLVAATIDSGLRPTGMDVVTVGSALELEGAVTDLVDTGDVDVVIMAAAVADFRPARVATTKIKKTHSAAGEPADESAPTIELVRNPDILAGLVARRRAAGAEGLHRPLIVGFAAETGDDAHTVLELGQEKLARKGCDLLVVNEVGTDLTFGADTNTVTILARDGADPVTAGPASKRDISRVVLDTVVAALTR